MKIENRIFNIGDKVRHFKGKEYQIVCFAIDSETLKDVVVYKALYDDKIYVRELKMFASPVDKNKYPKAEQKYRFEVIKQEK